MPEIEFTVGWPDGRTQRCISPSRTIERAIVTGARYPVGEFQRRARSALELGSERLRDLRGFGCSAAVQLIDELDTTAESFAETDLVAIERMRGVRPRRRFPAPEHIEGHRSVVIVGGGQAGLAASFELTQHGIDHVILERDRLAASWRDQRWDEFCLVTPNWQCQLPGHPYDGDDPDGFMLKDSIIDYIERYADAFGPPLYEGVAVTEVAQVQDGFTVTTPRGMLTCDHVVLAVGGYHIPRIPPIGAQLSAAVTQLHSSAYRNHSSLPDGGVLVVGSGQSGAQIAEDLHLAGREVHLAVGSAPRVARRYRGRDCVAWLHDIGHYRMPITEHPEGLSARREPNHYVTGRGGGRDIDLRAFARDGMRLHGRLLAGEGAQLQFAADLPTNLDAADATAERIKDTIDRWILGQDIVAPEEPRYKPVWQPPYDGGEPLDLDVDGVRTVIWATGFVPNWSWLNVAVFDERGYPEHERGITKVEGVSVLGLPWLHTWGSGRFAGIAEDAGHVAEHIAARIGGVAGRARSAA
jgi:putative flavoprotein involved in K+ transport